MNDLISRQDAIDELDKGAWGVEWDKALAKAMIESLPSAQPAQQWIPCSEMLPEKGEPVLVTVWNDVTIAWRNIYGGWESAEDMYEKGDVIAWIPLPEPYKGGDTE